ncbi:response regulator transcription factor [Arcanobacterium buesumense]|uniref:Response regulator transcription factor n=1 Tax=Arcanobacterium buesumense TaxID=2722751 RepID=A0A6H2ELC3_9ACTO|nr:response regulator transcription factor [Arcanobacterium buesumense]QJC21672.1 response regulator transcription factor [Arcanobacterium buesumense]
MDSHAKVLVYSDNRDVRESVMRAVGRKVRSSGAMIEWVEGATAEGTILKIKEAQEADKKFDLLILDAETPKLGGIGLGKMVRDEIDESIPYIVLIARPQDEWLARVARPEKILPYPIDAAELTAAVEDIIG